MMSQVDKDFFVLRRTLILEEYQTSSNSACPDQKCCIFRSKLPPEHLCLGSSDEQEAQWKDTSRQSVSLVFLHNNLTGMYRQPLRSNPQPCIENVWFRFSKEEKKYFRTFPTRQKKKDGKWFFFIGNSVDLIF